MEKKDWYKVEIRELIRKNLDRIHRKVGGSYGIDVSFLHKMISEYTEQELDKAREEGEIKGRLEALPITIEEIKNAKMKLLKRIISKYRKMGSSAGDYAMVYIEEELSKLKTKEDESKNKR